MNAQRMLWVVLPRNRTPSGVALSVFVSPRLEGPQTTLADFPEFADWPETLGGLRLKVEFDGGPTISEGPGSVSLQRVAAPPIEGIDNPWALLFTEALGVGAFDSIAVPRGIVSYSEAEVRKQVMGRMVSGAPSDDVVVPPEELGPLTAQEKRVAGETIERHLQEDRIADGDSAPPGGMTPTRFNLALAEYFQRQTASSATTVPAPSDTVDFHTLVAAVTEYSHLARTLGLVIDLEITGGPTLPEPDGRCRLHVEWDPSIATVNVTPWTGYRLTNGSFLPRPRDVASDIVGNLLDLRHRTNGMSTYLVDDLDPWGPLEELFNDDGETDASRPKPASPILLRSSGISVLRRGLAKQVGTDLDNSRRHEEDSSGGDLSPNLFAEDTIRGYRPDVRELGAQTWRSLNGRECRFRVRETGQEFLITDEGCVHATAVQVRAGAAGDAIGISETLFNWDGWSLVSPRPGKVVMADEQAGEPVVFN